MKLYKHIGYYDSKEDIIDLWPNETLKGDEADIVVKYWKDGYGAFHTLENGDLFSEDDFTEDLSEGRCDITSDKRYIVGFAEGDWKALAKSQDGNLDHGFYIDVWEIAGESDDLEELWATAESLTNQLKEVIEKIKRRTAPQL